MFLTLYNINVSYWSHDFRGKVVSNPFLLNTSNSNTVNSFMISVLGKE